MKIEAINHALNLISLSNGLLRWKNRKKKLVTLRKRKFTSRHKNKILVLLFVYSSLSYRECRRDKNGRCGVPQGSAPAPRFSRAFLHEAVTSEWQIRADGVAARGQPHLRAINLARFIAGPWTFFNRRNTTQQKKWKIDAVNRVTVETRDKLVQITVVNPGIFV